MSEKDKVLHRILTATQTGTIVCRIAKVLNIPSYEAFKRFIKSKTYANFRVAGSALSMCGDPAIVEEFLNETR
ncbi:MAG: hypothetical protein NC043_09185 [Muribaculaceae bacterium]|nr:hypothetical protein [Muribaculaceae bacterium]